MEPAYDVAVVGSGAAGLVAACRAADGGRSVVVLEKAELLGGTSAVSGGVMWMPANHLMGEQFPDSADGALAYLTAATGGRVPHERLRWYIETSREAVRWLDDETLVGSPRCPGPTITPSGRAPRAAEGWTTCRSTARSTRGSRPGCARRPTSRRSRWPSATPGPPRASTPTSSPAATPRAPGRWAARWSPRSWRRRRSGACEIVAACGVDDLAVRRRVRGRSPGCHARAVVLASGGFEWNPRLQAAFLPNPVTPISAPSNTGDGLELGLAAGAAVATMVAVWGVPVLADPAHVYDGRPSGRMANVELTLPGSVLVNARGRRFVNEATNYHDLNKVVPHDRLRHRHAR